MDIGVLIFDKAEEMDFVGPWEVLAAAIEGNPDHRIRLVAPSLSPIRCDKGMRVLPDVAYNDVDHLDVLIVPGGTGARLEIDNPATVAWVRKISKTCHWMTSVCTGSLLLVGAGVVDGRRATTHHLFVDKLADFGDVDVIKNSRFVVDGNLVTAAGVTSGVEMSLWLVAQLFGAEAEAYARDYIAYDTPPRGTEQLP